MSRIIQILLLALLCRCVTTYKLRKLCTDYQPQYPGQDLIACILELREYAKTDHCNHETIANCSLVISQQTITGDYEKCVLKYYTPASDFLWLYHFLYEYRSHPLQYRGIHELLQLARGTNAKVRSYTYPIVRLDIAGKMTTFPLVHPLPIVMTMLADVAQFQVEQLGYERTGKALGAAVTTVSCAAVGLAWGSLPGAAVGAGVGYIMWRCTEGMKDSETTRLGATLKGHFPA